MPRPIVQTPANEFHGQLSPDSQWIAYTSDESGKREVYVRAVSDGNERWKISTAGGEQPRWRSDGKELFYIAAGGKMMVAPHPSLDDAAPVELFDSRITAVGTSVSSLLQYDVTADGKRFVVVTTATDVPSAPPFTVVVNWTAGQPK